MAVATALSRATGLVRTSVLAAALGVTGLADAYNTANTVPNMLLMLVTGGTVTAVLIPMLATAGDPEEARERAEVAGGAIIALTLIGSVFLAVAAPLIVRFFASGRGADESRDAFLSVTTRWLMLFSPQLVLYGVSLWATAILNARGRLTLAAAASIATNLLVIAAVAVYAAAGAPDPPSLSQLTATPLLVLGLGTTAGVGAMAAIQVWGARRVMGRLRIRFLPRHPVVKRLWSLGRWTFVYVVVNQVGLAVVVAFANSVNGGITAYQWAFAIMQLPYGVLAVSILSAVFPRLAAAADEPNEGFRRQVAAGLRYSMIVMIPAAVALAVLAPEVAAAVIGYGAGSGSGSAFVASALVWFAAALVPFTLFQILTRTFYALEETRLPALVNIGVNVVFVGAGAAAVTITDPDRSRIEGIVIAYGLSYIFGVAALGSFLVRRIPGLVRDVARPIVRVIAASALVGGVLAVLDRSFTLDIGPASELVRSAVLFAIGGIVYVGAALLFRIGDIKRLIGQFTASKR